MGAIASTLFLTGCDSELLNNEPKYKLETIQGDTYLLNQDTGELSVLANGRIIKLENFSLPKNKLLSFTSDIENKLLVEIKTKLIGNQVLYAVTLSPKVDLNSDYEPVTDMKWFFDNIQKKEYEYNRIILSLQDADGFDLDSHAIYIKNDYTRMVDSQGNPASASYTGEFTVNPLKVESLTNVGFTYSMTILDRMPKVKKQEPPKATPATP